MDNKTNIIKQSIISFSGEITIKILGLLFRVYLVHNLMNATLSLGFFALAISFIEFFSPLTNLGLGGVSSKFIPKWRVNKEQNKINSFITSVFFITFILTSTVSIFIYSKKEYILSILPIKDHYHHLKNPEFIYFLPFFLFLMISKHFQSILNQILIGFKEVKKTVIYSNFIGFPLKFVFTVLLISIGLDFKGYLFSEVFSSIFIILCFFVVLRKITERKYKITLNFKWLNKQVVSYTIFFLGMAVLGKTSNLLDKWLLAKNMSINDVGIYYMTFTFINFIPIILQCINRIFAPIISELWEQKRKKEIEDLYKFFTKWSILFTLPIVCTVIFFSEDILTIFGKEFSSGKNVLIILSIAHSVSVIFGSVRTILQMTDKHASIFWIELVKNLIVVTSMFLLVPTYKMEGAAISLSLGIIFNNVINYIILYKHIKITPYQRDFWKIILVVLSSIALLYMLFENLFFLYNIKSIFISVLLILVITTFFSITICLNKKDKIVLRKLLAKEKE